MQGIFNKSYRHVFNIDKKTEIDFDAWSIVKTILNSPKKSADTNRWIYGIEWFFYVLGGFAVEVVTGLTRLLIELPLKVAELGLDTLKEKFSNNLLASGLLTVIKLPLMLVRSLVRAVTSPIQSTKAAWELTKDRDQDDNPRFIKNKTARIIIAIALITASVLISTTGLLALTAITMGMPVAAFGSFKTMTVIIPGIAKLMSHVSMSSLAMLLMPWVSMVKAVVKKIGEHAEKGAKEARLAADKAKIQNDILKAVNRLDQQFVQLYNDFSYGPIARIQDYANRHDLLDSIITRGSYFQIVIRNVENSLTESSVKLDQLMLIREQVTLIQESITTQLAELPDDSNYSELKRVLQGLQLLADAGEDSAKKSIQVIEQSERISELSLEQKKEHLKSQTSHDSTRPSAVADASVKALPANSFFSSGKPSPATSASKSIPQLVDKCVQVNISFNPQYS